MSGEEGNYDVEVIYSENTTFRVTEEKIRQQYGLMDQKKIVIKKRVLPKVRSKNNENDNGRNNNNQNNK